MRNARKPTRAERHAIGSYTTDPRNWRVITRHNNNLSIVHIYGNKVKTIPDVPSYTSSVLSQHRQVTFMATDPTRMLQPIHDTFHLDELGWTDRRNEHRLRQFCAAALKKWTMAKEIDELDHLQIDYFLE